MLRTIVRKEHKNRFERRAPLTPSALAGLRQAGFELSVERSDIRVFEDGEYQAVGAILADSPACYEFVIGIKEPPVTSIEREQVHLAFSHTIKGQAYNMALLQRFIDQKATLIDYEPIVDSMGQRTIAFGRYAGIAGAINSFHIAGKKWQLANNHSALIAVKSAIDYGTLEEVQAAFKTIDMSQGEPTRVLVVGTGKVGKGAVEVCRWLGLPEIDIDLLLNDSAPEGNWFAVASSQHLHCHDAGVSFNFDDFVRLGKQSYKSTFFNLLGKFDILLQTPFWNDSYPKHLPTERMKQFKEQLPMVIGDISCDINGSLECTIQASTTDRPAYTYNVDTGKAEWQTSWDGPTVMAIDNLPCELSFDASNHFSSALVHYMPELMAMDRQLTFDKLNVSQAIKDAIIVYNGALTPRYLYLSNYLSKK